MEGLLPGWEAVPSGEEFYYWNRSSACALPCSSAARRGAGAFVAAVFMLSHSQPVRGAKTPEALSAERTGRVYSRSL